MRQLTTNRSYDDIINNDLNATLVMASMIWTKIIQMEFLKQCFLHQLVIKIATLFPSLSQLQAQISTCHPDAGLDNFTAHALRHKRHKKV